MKENGKEVYIILLIYLCYVIREIWTVMPYSEDLINPFIYSNQLITKQTYIAYFCSYAVVFILLLCIGWLIEDYKLTMTSLIVLSLLEIFEYKLNYNEAWFKVNFFSLTLSFNITNIRYFSVATIFLIELTKPKWRE